MTMLQFHPQSVKVPIARAIDVRCVRVLADRRRVTMDANKVSAVLPSPPPCIHRWMPPGGFGCVLHVVGQEHQKSLPVVGRPACCRLRFAFSAYSPRALQPLPLGSEISTRLIMVERANEMVTRDALLSRLMVSDLSTVYMVRRTTGACQPFHKRPTSE